MKRILAGLALAAALGGCATAPSVKLTSAQAMLVADAGADGINHAAIAAAQAGVLKGAKAQTAKDALDAANQAVSAAKAAYSGDPVALAAQLTAALGKIAEAQQDIAQ